MKEIRPKNDLRRRTMLGVGAVIAGLAFTHRRVHGVAPGCAITSGASGTTARMADSAASVPGVNTHINYLASTYAKRFSTITKPRLLELGVRHIRDNPGGSSDNVTKGRFIELARAGITVLFAASDSDDRLSYVKALNASGVKVVDAIEPPNERDNAWGSAMPARMRDLMISLHGRYRGDAATRNLTILGPSFANTRDSADRLRAYFPTAANYMTAGNAHSYPGGREPDGRYGGGWGITLEDALARQRMGSSKPVWASESGYKLSGSRSGHYAVTERAAAKYMGRSILCHLAAGAARLYKYQLLNDNSEDFALLNHDGTPRLPFLALRNFMRLFADPGPSFETGTLAYSWSGSLSGIKQTLFQKRNGTFYLVVWQAVASSTVTTTDSGVRNLEPARRSLTLNLGMRMRAAAIYEPAFSPNPVRQLSSATGLSSLSLQVPDHLQVVELVPSACRT